MRIHDVSVLLAVPAPTLRSWERDSVLPRVGRDERGHRRYTKGDIAILRRMRDRRAFDASVRDAAALATAEALPTLCQRLLTAIVLRDPQQITAVLDASLGAHGLGAALDGVLLPAMREVGERWSRGQCDAPEEQHASTAVLAWLAQRSAGAPPTTDDRPIVLACGPQDQHTISLDAFSALLNHHGFRCHNLGAQTAGRSLRDAVEQTSAQAVVVVSQLSENRAAAASALRAADDRGAVLFYAGAAFRTTASRLKVPGTYLGGNLTRAALSVTSRLLAPIA